MVIWYKSDSIGPTREFVGRRSTLFIMVASLEEARGP